MKRGKRGDRRDVFPYFVSMPYLLAGGCPVCPHIPLTFPIFPPASYAANCLDKKFHSPVAHDLGRALDGVGGYGICGR